MNYQKADYILFNSVTDAIIKLSKSRVVSGELEEAIKILQGAQQLTEQLYISGD